jgi:hypothetical protein
MLPASNVRAAHAERYECFAQLLHHIDVLRTLPHQLDVMLLAAGHGFNADEVQDKYIA